MNTKLPWSLCWFSIALQSKYKFLPISSPGRSIPWFILPPSVFYILPSTSFYNNSRLWRCIFTLRHSNNQVYQNHSFEFFKSIVHMKDTHVEVRGNFQESVLSMWVPGIELIWSDPRPVLLSTVTILPVLEHSSYNSSSMEAPHARQGLHFAISSFQKVYFSSATQSVTSPFSGTPKWANMIFSVVFILACISFIQLLCLHQAFIHLLTGICRQELHPVDH